MTSFGPCHSHLGPPSAPSWPKVAIVCDVWGHVGVILELILGSVGIFFDACRLQEPNLERSSRHSESEALFSSIMASAPRCSGGFSLQWELCFHLGSTSGQECRPLAPFWRDLGAKSSTRLTFRPKAESMYPNGGKLTGPGLFGAGQVS